MPQPRTCGLIDGFGFVATSRHLSIRIEARSSACSCCKPTAAECTDGWRRTPHEIARRTENPIELVTADRDVSRHTLKRLSTIHTSRGPDEPTTGRRPVTAGRESCPWRLGWSCRPVRHPDGRRGLLTAAPRAACSKSPQELAPGAGRRGPGARCLLLSPPGGGILSRRNER